MCGYGLVVEYILAKDESGVRFSLPAQNNEHKAKLCAIMFFIADRENRRPEAVYKTSEVSACRQGGVESD